MTWLNTRGRDATCLRNAAFTARQKRTCFSSAVASCERRLQDLTLELSGGCRHAERAVGRTPERRMRGVVEKLHPGSRQLKY